MRAVVIAVALLIARTPALRTDPALPLGFPHIVNLVPDPKEREPFNPVHLHTWAMEHFGRLMKEFAMSVKRESLSPAGAPLDFVPKGR